ncbi:MAG: RNA-binding protein [Candidatus Margulisbacteria bacterium]|nr:RNA-binding protein [Candidatus Margulisiibacteriota bacterium]
MGKKLYVGGISYSSTEDSLKEAFTKAGTVESAVIITDKVSGKSKGFGFVEMKTDEEATKAIEVLNGTELDGRNISVAEARPPQKKEFGGPRGGDSRGGFNRDRGQGGFRRDR